MTCENHFSFSTMPISCQTQLLGLFKPLATVFAFEFRVLNMLLKLCYFWVWGLHYMLSLRLTRFRTLQKLMVLVSTPRDADLSGSEREQGNLHIFPSTLLIIIHKWFGIMNSASPEPIVKYLESIFNTHESCTLARSIARISWALWNIYTIDTGECHRPSPGHVFSLSHR